MDLFKYFMILVTTIISYSSLGLSAQAYRLSCQVPNAFIEFNLVDQVDWYKAGHDGQNWFHLEYFGKTSVGIAYFHEIKSPEQDTPVVEWIRLHQNEIAKVSYFQSPYGILAKYHFKEDLLTSIWAIPIWGSTEILVFPEIPQVCGPQFKRNWFEKIRRIFTTPNL